jgi:hypothetical protein
MMQPMRNLVDLVWRFVKDRVAWFRSLFSSYLP